MNQSINTVRAEVLFGAFDLDIRGVRKKEGEWVFDRRYTVEGAERRGLSPRIADINIIGAECIPLTPSEISAFGLED